MGAPARMYWIAHIPQKTKQNLSLAILKRAINEVKPIYLISLLIFGLKLYEQIK